MTDRRGPHAGLVASWAAPVLLVMLTWAALGGVVRNGFVNYDDDLYLTANPRLSAGLGVEGLTWAFTTTRGGNWHPVTWISHLIDVRLFGMDPGAHHAVNLALHCLNVLLLFALLRGLSGALGPSALVAALFAVHPLHVESVAWAAERKDVLSTLFALGAALAYAHGLRRPGGRACRAAVPVLFMLALMSKPMPLSLPLLLLLLDWWPLGRWAPHPTPGAARAAGIAFARNLLPPARLLTEKVPLLLLAAVSGVVTWSVQAGAGAMQATANIPLPARAANAAISYTQYLRKMLWPSDLAVYYPYPWHGHPPLAVVVALGFLAALAALGLHQARRRPWVPVGLLWYFVSLLPAIGLVQVGIQAMADRYTYLPLIGAYLALAWSLREWAGRGRLQAQAMTLVSVATVGLLAFAASRQVRTWRDQQTLFTHALAVTRDNFVAHNNLGAALARQGAPAEALSHFRDTIRLAPRAPKGYLNLGRALAQLGRHEEALVWYHEAIARDPLDPYAQRNLGRSLEALRRPEEALWAYREALRLEPNDPATLDMLGVSLARSGRAEEAVALLEKAVALAPGNVAIRWHLDVARAQAAAPAPRRPIDERAGR